ncbi:GNAT family N-acetyltransferase [Aridibaculum aurantiacum]|uniref:GNAT family N-acetyltransferase n=1 Tax=Aridibaculum aurantiacum TaxID=2810307 RepID=UPI001A976895|nr:GNAT family N-acetyltransferase [Aridibaculum aurantiacum]
MSLVIQQATVDDVPALVKLVNSAYRGNDARQGWTHEADLIDGTARITEEQLVQMLASPDNTMLLLKKEEELAGCVMLERTADEMMLGMLSVSPPLQDEGIGKQLITLAETFAMQQGVTKMIMTVISVRHELLAWYKRRGYHETGETKPFPEDAGVGKPKQPLHFVVLEKQLRESV